MELIYHDLKEIEDFQKTEVNEEKKWKFEHQIEARNITYAYPDSEKNVLENAGCVIPKGKTAAFIGGSGAGKTTIVDIILGLLTPQVGKVMADDMNIFKNCRPGIIKLDIFRRRFTCQMIRFVIM